MQLLLINGSARRKKSNSGLLLEHFVQGYSQVNSGEIPLFYLASEKQQAETLDAFLKSESCILIFPLYADSIRLS